ncbi:MAG: hypothetical protein WBP11_04275 [Dokdonella sp.]
MQCLKFSIVISGLFCLGAVAPAAAQEHEQHENMVVASPQAPAQGWATDAPLRAGMANIRTSVEALRYLQRGDISRQHALAEVAMIDQSIDHIIANCKLDPDADAVLHQVIAKLVHGSAGLKSDLMDKAAMASLRAALLDYQRLFDDPDWSSDSAVE